MLRNRCFFGIFSAQPQFRSGSFWHFGSPCFWRSPGYAWPDWERLPALILIPFLWTGLEYFRSELYYLRFSWLNAGYAFADNLQWLPLKQLGVYGMGFLFMAVISLSTLLQRKQRIATQATLLVALGILANLPARSNLSPASASDGIQCGRRPNGIPLGTADYCKPKSPHSEEIPKPNFWFSANTRLMARSRNKIKAWCREKSALFDHRRQGSGAGFPILRHRFCDWPRRRHSFPSGQKCAHSILQGWLAGPGTEIVGIALGKNWHLHLLRFELHPRHGSN